MGHSDWSQNLTTCVCANLDIHPKGYMGMHDLVCWLVFKRGEDGAYMCEGDKQAVPSVLISSESLIIFIEDE